MPNRLTLGPVFEFEWLSRSRRWQVFAVRSLFVSGLLIGLFAVWMSEVDGRPVLSVAAQARVGVSFFYAIVGTQLALVLLVAPAATAGAICLERARGTLTHLLVTDLSDSEIVLGKLVARVLPMASLVSCALPVMALGTLLGGIDPWALTYGFLISLGSAVFSSSLALTLSVWGKKTPDVLLLAYTILLFWVLGGPLMFLLRWGLRLGWKLPDWFTSSNPFWLAFAPYARPGSTDFTDVAIFLAATLALSALLAVVAVWKLRVVAARQEGSSAQPRVRRWVSRLSIRWTDCLPGPSLDGNPVLWREWHRTRPSRWTRIVWLIHAAFAIVCLVLIVQSSLSGGPMGRANSVIPCVMMGTSVAAGLLILSVIAPSSLSEERTRGSLDVIMATPLSTFSIYWGKWWGTYRIVVLLATPPALASIAIGIACESLFGPILQIALILAYGAAFTSLGLALATWIPRPNRAIAASAALYIVMTVGWLFVAIMLTRNGGSVTGPGLASGSPFLGSMFILIEMQETLTNVNQWYEAAGWIVFWTFFYGAVTIALILMTLATFDRSLGRMSVFDRLTRRKHFEYPPIVFINSPHSHEPQADCTAVSP